MYIIVEANMSAESVSEEEFEFAIKGLGEGEEKDGFIVWEGVGYLVMHI
tara:strand:+ start:492 stop:638 length:147 start_codon:yes stop_codon:yes gene_type:complete